MKIWLKRFLILLALLIIVIAGWCLYRMNSFPNAVPVLNYHQINDQDKNSLTVTTAEFDQQMQYLAANGYHAITPEEMVTAWQEGRELPDKPVIITLDDGYADNYHNAYPILEKYQLKATIFVVTDFVSMYPNYLSWPEISEMQQSGLIDFESHTLSHPQLDQIPPDEVKKQLTESKAALEWHLQKPIDFIAYPCGDYDQALEQMTKDAGYKAAFTVHYGLATPTEDAYILDRVPIFGDTGHMMLRFKLRLNYAPIFAPLDQLERNLLADGHDVLARFVPAP